jgi:hypothetical protein
MYNLLLDLFGSFKKNKTKSVEYLTQKFTHKKAKKLKIK